MRCTPMKARQCKGAADNLTAAGCSSSDTAGERVQCSSLYLKIARGELNKMNIVLS
jgi:hypothetical protein